MGKKKKAKHSSSDRNVLAKELAENRGQNKADRLAYREKNPDLRWKK